MAQDHVDQELYRAARAQFAYFDEPREAFMENAGGSQVPNVVIDAIADYMRTRSAPHH
jgi:selenocysteine lyase/cysteine desulfurase